MNVRFKDTNRLKIKEWKKMYHVNSNHKKADVAMETKQTLKQCYQKQRGTFDNDKSYHQEDIKIINKYI